MRNEVRRRGSKGRKGRKGKRGVLGDRDLQLLNSDTEQNIALYVLLFISPLTWEGKSLTSKGWGEPPSIFSNEVF